MSFAQGNPPPPRIPYQIKLLLVKDQHKQQDKKRTDLYSDVQYNRAKSNTT